MYLKYREVLDIFMRGLPDAEENKDEVFQANAELFFRARIELLRSEEEPDDIAAVKLLNEITLGYACWLDDVHV